MVTPHARIVAAAAAMILVEECKLRLDDPVDGLLPELADRRVLKRLDGPLDDTEPAKRAITLRDLLTLRMGFGMLMVPPDTYPIQTAVDDLQLGQGLHRPSLPPEQRETRPSIQREDQLTMETKLEQIRIVLSVR